MFKRTRIQYEVDDVDSYAPKIERIESQIVLHAAETRENGASASKIPSPLRGCTQAYMDGFMGNPYSYDDLDPATLAYCADYARGQNDARLQTGHTAVCPH